MSPVQHYSFSERRIVSIYLPFRSFSSLLLAARDIVIYVKTMIYRKVSNISRTKFQNLSDSRPGLQLSVPNLLKPCIKSRMKK